MGDFVRIGKAAAFLGITPSKLREWEEEGKFHPDRDHNGWRLYSKVDLQAFSDSLTKWDYTRKYIRKWY